MQLSATGQVIAVTATSATYTLASGSQTGRGCLAIGTSASEVFIDWTGADFAVVAASEAAGTDKNFLSSTSITAIRIPAKVMAFSVKCGGSNTATMQYIADQKE